MVQRTTLDLGTIRPTVRNLFTTSAIMSTPTVHCRREGPRARERTSQLSLYAWGQSLHGIKLCVDGWKIAGSL